MTDDRFGLLRKASPGLNSEDHLYEVPKTSGGGSNGGVAQDFRLRLSFTDAVDGGGYECQISTVPKISKVFALDVVGEFESLF